MNDSLSTISSTPDFVPVSFEAQVILYLPIILCVAFAALVILCRKIVVRHISWVYLGLSACLYGLMFYDNYWSNPYIHSFTRFYAIYGIVVALLYYILMYRFNFKFRPILVVFVLILTFVAMVWEMWFFMDLRLSMPRRYFTFIAFEEDTFMPGILFYVSNLLLAVNILIGMDLKRTSRKSKR